MSDSVRPHRLQAAHQAPPSLGFSRQEHWSGLPFPSPRHEREKWKGSRSVVSDSSRPRGLQPTRLLRPWDFPGKSTGVGCHHLLRSHFLGLSKSLYRCLFIFTKWSLTNILLKTKDVSILNLQDIYTTLDAIYHLSPPNSFLIWLLQHHWLLIFLLYLLLTKKMYNLRVVS